MKNNINIFSETVTLHLNNGATVEAVGEKRNRNCKPVICDDTGEIYTSVSDAAIKNGVSLQAMSHHLNGDCKKCKGKKFRFLTNRDDSFDAMASNLRRLNEENSSLIEDAMKWREYQAQIEAERKAKEKLEKALARTKERIEKHEAKLEKEKKILATLWEELDRLEANPV